MKKPSRSLDWYEKRALQEARATSNKDGRRKHLAIAWRSRLASQQTASWTLRGLSRCYQEGSELLGNPLFDVTARCLAQTAAALEKLKRTRGADRLFILEDTVGERSHFTLRHIKTVGEAFQINSKMSFPHTTLDVTITDEHAVVGVRRTQEITSLHDPEVFADPTRAEIARLSLPWKIGMEATDASPQPWAGTLVVGRRAIEKWVAGEHDDPRASLFAARVHALPEDAWPVVAYNISPRPPLI